MMNCVHCGKESEEILCQDCMTADNIKTAFYNLLYYDSGTGNQSLREYVDSHGSPLEAKKDGLPYLLEHFDGPDADFLWCRYYKEVKDERFEEAAVSYLESHEDMDVNYQKLLLDLMGYYSRHEFEKPRKWADKIAASDDLCAELYYQAAQYYGFVGEYDEALRILDSAIQKCEDPSYDNLLYNWREQEKTSLLQLKADVMRYKDSKPYWPTNQASKEKLAVIYDEKGIKHPRVAKPKKVASSQFAPVLEYLDGAPDDYCTFWCEDVHGPAKSRCICQIAAVKVRGHVAVEQFQSYVRPWDSSLSSKEDAAKRLGIRIEDLNKADDVDVVMKRFFDFVDGDVLVSTDALGNQMHLITRAARYAGMSQIASPFLDVLDYAADVSAEFDLKNNTRKYLLTHFALEEGKDAVGKAELNMELLERLREMEEG